MKIYKDSNGVIWFGTSHYPKNTLGITSEGDYISIWEYKNDDPIFSGLYTSILDINGDAYVSVADFLSMFGDYFSSDNTSDIVTATEDTNVVVG